MKKEDEDFFIYLDKNLLASQLLEVSLVLIESITKYAEANGIELQESPRLNRLMLEAKWLIDDVNRVDLRQLRYFKLLSNESLHEDKSNTDLTEPRTERLISDVFRNIGLA